MDKHYWFDIYKYYLIVWILEQIGLDFILNLYFTNCNKHFESKKAANGCQNDGSSAHKNIHKYSSNTSNIIKMQLKILRYN